MDDEDERVTEFVAILSNAVEREAENKALRAQRDELLEALEMMLACTEGQAIYNFMEPQREKARAAIAKAKGSQSYP